MTTETENANGSKALTNQAEHALFDERHVSGDVVRSTKVSDKTLSDEGTYKQKKATYHAELDDGRTFRIQRNYASRSGASNWYVSEIHPDAFGEEDA